MTRRWTRAMDRERDMDMDIPRHWVFRVSNALTVPMQGHLWAAYSDLVSVAVPDSAPPGSATWSLTLGRRVFATDESGSSSANTSAGTRGANVTPGTLQHHASSPAARAAALRFMATIDLLFGGAGEGRGRIENGPLTPDYPGPSPAAAWGGWGGCQTLVGSPRDMCAQVDFSSLHTARIMQCVPGADGKREIHPAEIDAAADAVRARCGVSPDTDIMPFRLGGLGTCVTIEVGTDESYRLCEGYDEGYAFYINLRPPEQKCRTLEFHMLQLNMVVPLTAGDLLGFRSAVQVHVIKDGADPDKASKKSKKKKNRKKNKKAAAAAGAAGADDHDHDHNHDHDHDHDGEEGDEDDADSDVDNITTAMSASRIGASSAGPSSAGPSARPSGASSAAAPSSSAGPARRRPGPSAASGPSSTSWTAGSSAVAAASSSTRSSCAGPSSAPPTSTSTSTSTYVSGSGSGSGSGATRARSTPPPAAKIDFSSMPRVMITVWTDIETVANVAMAAKLVWPELKIAGIESPPPSPTLTPVSGKRRA